MTLPTPRPSARVLGLFAIAVGVAVLATHAIVLAYGLRMADYFMLRPFGSEDVRQVLTGSWGPPGNAIDAYYRPMTALYFAAVFWLGGLHGTVLHALSLIELSVVTWLLGVYIWRDAGPRAAIVGALLYLIHPILPDSTSAWIFNQMHLLALLIVVGALLVWQSRRMDPRPRAWWPIFALAIIGAFVKEDTVVVLPAILLLHWCRARFVNDVPPLTTALIAATIAVAAGLAAMRLWLFPHFEVFEPSPNRPWQMIALIAAYGPGRTAALMFENVSLAPVATAFVLALQALGAWRARTRPASSAGWLWIQGAVLLVCFSVPAAFAYDLASARLHLLVFSASLMFAAGAATVIEWCTTRRGWQAGVAVALLIAGAANLGAMQRRSIIRRFAPCSPETAWVDRGTTAWDVVTNDIKHWLELKMRACADGRYQPMEDAVETLQWRTDVTHVLAVHRGARGVSFSLPPDAADRPPRVALVNVDGIVHRVPLSSFAITRVWYPLSATWQSWLRAAHRVDIVMEDEGRPPLPEAVSVTWPLTPK